MSVVQQVVKDISWQSVADIQTICQPLFDTLDLNFFAYTKFDKTKSAVQMLHTHQEWHDYYINKKFVSAVKFLPSGTHLWADYISTAQQDAKQYFDLANGLSIIRHYETYTELYAFAMPSDSKHALSFYFNNLDLLEKFNLYFKDKAQALLNPSEEKTTILYGCTKQVAGSLTDENAFLKSIEPTKYYFNINGKDRHLSKREVEIIRYLANGYSAKAIAELFEIAVRTVNHHIENIKAKLVCTKSTEILIKAVELHLIS